MFHHAPATADPDGATCVVNATRRKENCGIDPGKFAIGSAIARGGFGVVYEGKYGHATCAIKEMRLLSSSGGDGTSEAGTGPSCSVQGQDLATYIKEVEMLSEIRHPNLVCFWGFSLRLNTSNPCFYILMELCHSSLEAILKEHFALKTRCLVTPSPNPKP
jgi:serine/threonine protein kinase